MKLNKKINKYITILAENDLLGIFDFMEELKDD